MFLSLSCLKHFIITDTYVGTSITKLSADVTMSVYVKVFSISKEYYYVSRYTYLHKPA